MKELGQLTYVLGLEVRRRSQSIFLNRNKYIQDLIQLARLTEIASDDTSMEINVKCQNDEGELLEDPTLYRKLVGSFIYLTVTRLDIFYVVHKVSKFMEAPRHLHLAIVRRIIHYLIGS